ncbi:hypothetical protein LTS10_010222 [Elasticomyces elasticus]|nr:hypothetical protein LTS10_010222 [Elasticomyces elasticus]
MQSLIATVEHNAEGYALVANFQSSDRNFLQYRAFFHLHSRVLSALQADIVKLESELDSMDRWDIRCGMERLQCLQDKNLDDIESHMENMPEPYRAWFGRTRPTVLHDLKAKLLEYDELLLRTREVHGLQRPAQRDYQSVRNWFESMQPLVPDQLEFIRRKEDIITLRAGRECASFDGFVERCLNGLDGFLSKYCRCKVIKVGCPRIHVSRSC